MEESGGRTIEENGLFVKIFEKGGGHAGGEGRNR